MRRQLSAFGRRSGEQDVPIRVSNVTGRGAALIVYPTADAPPSQGHLPYPIGAALWKLSTLNASQTGRLHETDHRRSRIPSLEIFPEPGSDPNRHRFLS